jgi:hypothetical protein
MDARLSKSVRINGSENQPESGRNWRTRGLPHAKAPIGWERTAGRLEADPARGRQETVSGGPGEGPDVWEQTSGPYESIRSKPRHYLPFFPAAFRLVAFFFVLFLARFLVAFFFVLFLARFLVAFFFVLFFLVDFFTRFLVERFLVLFLARFVAFFLAVFFVDRFAFFFAI